MNYEDEQYQRAKAECERRGYDFYIVLRLAHAFDAIRNEMRRKKRHYTRKKK